MSTAISSLYGSNVKVIADSANTVAANFDKNTLLPLRISTKTFKGGIYFVSSTTSLTGADVSYQFTTLVNTRTTESPLFLANIATEAIINNLGRNVKIQVTNHPMPRTQSQLNSSKALTGFIAGFFMSMALAFKFTSTIAFIIKERVNKSKHQMVISGMNIKAYWLANFVFDILLYMIIASLSVGAALVLDVKSLIG